MFRTFSYNPDYIVHVIQMRFNQKPFEEQRVTLDPGWSPSQPLHDTLFSYDFAFEEEVLAKSTEQLQNVVYSEPCSNKVIDELVIPIENLIAGANVAPSTLDPSLHGNKSQVNIEDFDSHNTDPFQDAELKTINDIEELQTLIFPHLPPQNMASEDSELKEPEIKPNVQDTQERPSEFETEVDNSKQKHQDGNTSSAPHSLEELTSDPISYMNINELPLIEDTLETHSQSQSPKPPVPAPRKLKVNALTNGNSPTPIPRHSAPKSPLARPAPTDSPELPRNVCNVGRNGSYLREAESMPSDPSAVPPPPVYLEIGEQEDTYPEQLSGLSPPQFPTNQAGLVITNLSESIIGDIKRQVIISSAIPPQTHAPPLSEGDNFYRKIADMGFPLDCVKKISISFDTKDERQVIDHVLAVLKVKEENKWPLGLVEVAYVFVKGETDKMKPYIETFLKYKEMGFPDEKIHSALEKCGKDYEKMLEILIETS